MARWFEVTSAESLAHAGRKAAELVRRGVRRVFAIDVERQRGLEWSPRTGGWEILGPDAVIDDPALVIPLPVHDLVAAAHSDDAVARALLAKDNPVLVANIARERAEAASAAASRARLEATVEATARAVVAVLEARGLAPTDAQRRTIASTDDLATLERWHIAAIACVDVDDLLAQA